VNIPILKNRDHRIESLDFLRGIAAFGVMLFHYTAETSIELSPTNPLRITGSYGHLGVEIFFILSGVVIPYSMYAKSYTITSIGKFLLKRTTRIEIPYLSLIVVEIFLIYVSSLTPWKTGISERLDGYNILLHVGYLNGVAGKPWLIPVFWTLAVEFQFYLLIALVFPILTQSKFINRTPILGVLVLFSYLFPQSYLFFNYSMFFVLGILVFQVMTGISTSREFLAVLAGVLPLVYLQHGLTTLLIVMITSFICATTSPSL